MRPATELGRATTPDGTELLLYERDGVFRLRVDGFELMSSRAHGSETALADLACERLPSREAPRVLVGGLGFGYTLRAVLDALPASARVVVAEMFDAVVEWNQGPLAALARRPLADPRVEVRRGDVATVFHAARPVWDAVLLDVDNGPESFTLRRNHRLYGVDGLTAIHRCMVPKGVLAVWSAFRDDAFVRRLLKAGFEASAKTAFARGTGGGPRHTIFLGIRAKGPLSPRAAVRKRGQGKSRPQRRRTRR